MDKNKKIICDRCAEIIEIGESGIYYYDVTEGFWQQFQRWEEELVCVKCMQKDKKYQKHLNNG